MNCAGALAAAEGEVTTGWRGAIVHLRRTRGADSGAAASYANTAASYANTATSYANTATLASEADASSRSGIAYVLP